MQNATTWILLLITLIVAAVPVLRGAIISERSRSADVLSRSDRVILSVYGMLIVGILAYWVILGTMAVPRDLAQGDLPASAAGQDLQAAVSPEECGKARDAVLRLADASRGMMRQDDAGTLTVGAGLWEQIPQGARSSLVALIARAAACPDGDPEQQIVTVREASSGKVLGQGVPSSFQ